jgi:SAM domain (Sterile alpha motif)
MMTTTGRLSWTLWSELPSLGLGKYEALFRGNDIDETVLPTLTAQDLKELGVVSFGHRRSSSMPSLLFATARAVRRPPYGAGNCMVRMPRFLQHRSRVLQGR